MILIIQNKTKKRWTKLIFQSNKIYSIYICGIGGQGIISLSKKLVDLLAVNPRISKIVVAESRGVSQREGMVSAVIRFIYNDSNYDEQKINIQKKYKISELSLGPFSYPRFADIFIGLDLIETLRNLKFLSKNATAIINTSVNYPKSVKQEEREHLNLLISTFDSIMRETFPKTTIIKRDFTSIALEKYQNVVMMTNLFVEELFSAYPTIFLK